ncbi:MAG: FecR family protein [Gammaproteobacteria bacterium]
MRNPSKPYPRSNAAHILGLVLLMLVLPWWALAQTVGEVTVSRGANTAQQGDEAPRLLGKSAELNQGDIVTTGRKSFIVMKMNDGTRMTLRPNTVFKVEEWNAKEREESAVLRLFRGGLRAISGAIAKRNPSAFRLQTSVATIGIRGTTFDARLCEEGCKDDAKNYTAVAAKVSKVVGRIGFLKGDATAARKEASVSRLLTTGAPIYEGDTIITQSSSFVVMLFKDRSRVTLRANSEFMIESLKFKQDDNDTAVFRLLRGGLRAVSGLIGKRNASRVKFRTAIATIGIRGTGFDLICQNACAAQSRSTSWLETVEELLLPSVYAATPNESGLIVAPWSNTVIVELPSGNIEVLEGQIAFVPADGSPPIFIPVIPTPVEEPKPEDVEIDEEKFLDAETPQEPERGLYVACHEGHCLLGDVSLGEGETAFKSDSGGETTRFEIIPQFLDNDVYFKTLNIDTGVLDILGGEADPSVQECTFL